MSEDVYEPREDTQLLLEVALSYCSEDDDVLEVGCGSGYISDELESCSNQIVATDISRPSVVETKNRNSRINSTVGNLSHHFKENSFSLVLFNPPYLPPSDEDSEFTDRALTHEDNLELIRDFINDSHRVLQNDGQCLLLVSSRTGVKRVTEISESIGFSVDTTLEMDLFFEKLLVLRLTL